MFRTNLVNVPLKETKKKKGKNEKIVTWCKRVYSWRNIHIYIYSVGNMRSVV